MFSGDFIVSEGHGHPLVLYIKVKMVSVRLSIRPGVDLGFRTSTNGQDQVLKSKSGGLPRVNTRVFFFPALFSGELPRVNTTVFFCFFSTLFRQAAQG